MSTTKYNLGDSKHFSCLLPLSFSRSLPGAINSRVRAVDGAAGVYYTQGNPRFSLRRLAVIAS